MSLDISSFILLNDGNKMPQIGLGVYNINPVGETEQAVLWALEAGYRHIDTAKLYRNETYVGDAVKKSGLNRKEIWITTKLWPTDFTNPKKACEESLRKLGMDYVDLYLIHWPTPVEIPGFERRLWKAMEDIRESGVAKSIGVSNYHIPRLDKILSIANIPPAVNQVRCSPFYYPEELHAYCRDKNIAFEAYSPLTRGSRLQDKALFDVAQKYHKSTAQILIRWALQKEIIVIPKSQNQERIKENIDVFDFEISEDDMLALDSLSSN